MIHVDELLIIIDSMVAFSLNLYVFPQDQQTPLHETASASCGEKEIVKLLVHHGANIELKDQVDYVHFFCLCFTHSIDHSYVITIFA